MTETMTAAEYRKEMRKPKGESESARTRALFLFQIAGRRLPTPRSKSHPDGEVRFMGGDVVTRQSRKLKCPDRPPGWRFDYAWEDHRLAVEIEGLVVYKGADGRMATRGRHTTPEGFNDDCEKYAWAAVKGWRVVRFTPKQVKGGFAIDMLVRLFAVVDEPVRIEVPRIIFDTEALQPSLHDQAERLTNELAFGRADDER